MTASPVRILHIIGTLNYGGAETLLMELYRHIDRKKVQFNFFVYNYGDSEGAYDAEIRSLGGRIFYAKRRLYKEPFAFRNEILDFCREHGEYRIIHSHMNMRGGFMLQPFRKGLQCITIAHSHTAYPNSDLKNKLVNCLGRLLLRKSADFYMGCSEDALVTICGKTSNGESRFVLRNAVDARKFEFLESCRRDIRDSLGIGKNTIVLINVARFTAEKNHIFQIDVFSEILKRNPDCRLLLVGVGPDFDKIRAYASERLRQDSYKVVFLGQRSDVNYILNGGDVFLFPSRGEGLGIVAIEAQANGLPCVMSEDVIPEEADVHSGLVTRVSLSEPASIWAEKCLEAAAKGRLGALEAQEAIRKAGYDIHDVAGWLQDFYLKHWKE